MATVIDIGHLGVVQALVAGEDISAERIFAADARQGAGGLAQLLAFLLTAVGFLFWFRRAYRNLPALGAEDLRFKPGWAVGAWFVPILGLIRPKMIANDIWRASDPDFSAASGNDWHDSAVAPLLHWWWATFLISSMVSQASGRMLLTAETLSEQQRADQIAVGADIASIISGVVAILAVRALTRRQETRIAELGRELA